MPLPGKMCVGILEEDNPQKSYFRFKPLLVANEDAYLPFDEPDAYGLDGCIRIVPDKNESSRFKARMREMGRYCVVDLREHPGDSDKIRPNKNYRGDSEERNQYIIYSDVVREPSAEQLMEIIPLEAGEDAASMAVVIDPPCTKHVLLRRGAGLCMNPFLPAPLSEPQGSFSLTRESAEADGEALQEFTLQGFGGSALHIAVARPGRFLLPPKEPEAKPPEALPPAVEAREEPAAALTPSAPPTPPQEKPWLSRSAPAHARWGDPRPPFRDQGPASQTGFNPRRGRSLQEIVEEKWRRSRLEQLGHPVPGEATGQPLISPVEKAVSAVREAWYAPESRACLLGELSRLEDFGGAMADRRNAVLEKQLDERMCEMEERRLTLEGEIKRLQQAGADTRARLKRQISQECAAEFADMNGKAAALRDSLKRRQDEADAIRAAADEAEKRFVQATDSQLRERLISLQLDRRLFEAAQAGVDPQERPAPAPVETCTPDAEAMIARVLSAFGAREALFTREDAVNLLICLAQSPATILSGPTGSGKTFAALALARALGLTQCGRFRGFSGDKKPLGDEPDFRGLNRCRDGATPLIAFIDDANALPHADPARRALTFAEGPDANPALRLLLAAQDSHAGFPLGAPLLDRAFLVRLRCEASDAPWAPAEPEFQAAEPPVSLQALTEAFGPGPEGVPREAEARMAKFRSALGSLGAVISRRSLDAAWRYVAAMCRLTQTPPLAALDLALAQRVLPALLATSGVEALMRLGALTEDMPKCQSLLRQPIPLDL